MTTYTGPFTDQVDFFTAKLQVIHPDFLADPNASHAKAFTVAGVASRSLLDDLRESVSKFIASGFSFSEFKTQFEAIVAKNGWTGWTGEGTPRGRAWRSRIIAETNLRTSYSVGRIEQQVLAKEDRPYLIYRHSAGEMYPRPVHVAWDGIVLPMDHPWWRDHYPPCGYGCKCMVFSMSEQDLIERGLSVTDDSAIRPGDADPGFGAAPQLS